MVPKVCRAGAAAKKSGLAPPVFFTLHIAGIGSAPRIGSAPPIGIILYVLTAGEPAHLKIVAAHGGFWSCDSTTAV